MEPADERTIEGCHPRETRKTTRVEHVQSLLVPSDYGVGTRARACFTFGEAVKKGSRGCGQELIE